MGDHYHVDFGRHAVEILFQKLYVERFPELLVDHERARFALHGGHHAADAAVERQVRDDADFRLLLAVQLVDQVRQIVFEIFLAVLDEEWDDLAAADRVRADEAEMVGREEQK